MPIPAPTNTPTPPPRAAPSTVPQGPLHPGLAPLARVAERVYRAELARRNRRFDRGSGVVTIDRPVISIGNLSVGGTGKTPMVAAALRWLIDAGHRPAVAMRGYRAGPSGESDEAAAYARAFPDTPVIAQPARAEGLIQHFATAEGRRTDAVVLDDGFQHRRLARQLDIVLIDASKGDLAGRLLPAGWLREPFESLARAHAVVLTHAELASPSEIHRLSALVERHHGGPPIAVCRHVWTAVDVFDGARGVDEPGPISRLVGARSLAVCAIGSPGPFLRHAREASGQAAIAPPEPIGPIVLRDHDPYRPGTIARILAAARAAGADLIITTDKDWSKLRRVRPDAWPCPVARPVLGLQFDRGEEHLRGLILAAAADPVDEGEPDQPLSAAATPAPCASTS